jgi:hypothetical protein
MKSMLQKFSSVSKSGMRKEVKQSRVGKGYVGDGGDESGGDKERDGGGDGGNNGNDENGGNVGMKDEKKDERAEKEGGRQCLSSKCLVEQLPNTLSVSFKGQLLMLYFLSSSYLSYFTFFLFSAAIPPCPRFFCVILFLCLFLILNLIYSSILILILILILVFLVLISYLLSYQISIQA